MRCVIKSSLFFYTKRISVHGKVYVPKKGAVLFMVNHPNGLLDPLVVAVNNPRILHFLVQAAIFKNPTINRNEINTSKFNIEDLIIWHHDSDTVKVGAARLIQLVKNDLENFNNVSIYSNHALVLISNGKATQREILSFANNIKDVVNETFNISLDIEPTVIN